MELKLYNTLTRSKEIFKPIDPQNVRMYGCGPTVYNYAHIGNARAAVVMDVLYRLLRHIYGTEHVKFVRNITDVDDKIMEAARQSGEGIDVITRKYEKIYNEDMAALGCLPPDVQPRCTEHIQPMQDMIAKLIKSGNAYEAQGNVLFSVPSMSNYGRLSRKNRDELVAGARVDVAPYKRDAADFVLWKPSEPEQVGWDSPWGRGRPGWHIECSAMSEAHLGETFDIHCGGLDLIFPHHENEIAQSECAHGGKVMANYWVHNGFLNMGDEKMSKSLGNVVLVHDLLKKWPGEVIRLALLSAHYRQPLSFTEDLLLQSKAVLDAGYRALQTLRDVEPLEAEEYHEDLYGHLAPLFNDLDTSKAIMDERGRLGQLAKDLNAVGDFKQKRQMKALILTQAKLLGIYQHNPDDWFAWKPADADIDDAVVQSLVEGRAAAKKAKNFAESDRIRDELKAMGIALEDGPQGTTWRYVCK